jgi:xanthine dehydrogenase small subunit
VTAYLRPRSLAEAVDARATHGDWLILAGGTDALVSANHKPAPVGILDLWRLPELGQLGLDAERREVTIGAGATWLEIQRSAEVLRHLPILAAAAREIGALQIQARGTIGGNVVTASPVGDSLPVLLALEAEVMLASPRGARRVAYRDFITGRRTTAMLGDELLAAVCVPLPSATTQLRWRKVGTRRAQSISKVMAAAAIDVEHGVVRRAVLGMGAMADRPIRLAAVEAAVQGLPWSQCAEAARAIMPQAVSPISDLRSTRDYRLEVATNLVARFFS